MHKLEYSIFYYHQKLIENNLNTFESGRYISFKKILIQVLYLVHVNLFDENMILNVEKLRKAFKIFPYRDSILLRRRKNNQYNIGFKLPISTFFWESNQKQRVSK